MMQKLVRVLIPLFITIGLVFVLNKSWGPIPPIGKFFGPYSGFLNQKDWDEEMKSDLWTLDGLKDSVSVIYDQNRVPHIFAQNDEDLYFAQGYVLAMDRLWQMEFYTLSASGRLTEVVGEAALDLDRYNRRIGMPYTARLIVENLKKNDPVSWEVLEAYSAGVNAYIAQIKNYHQLPIEYKILNYSPEEWTPYKSILMLMNMRITLNGGTHDLRMTNIYNHFGMDVIRELFPIYPFDESPIIPSGTQWDFSGVDKALIPPLFPVQEGVDSVAVKGFSEPSPHIGSNNWAVSGEKTVTGLPMLANDPHLGLSFPSIWYQIQLSTPTSNVYGVALPGTPAVIIGFNKDIAWGVTNVGSDVMDFYKIQFKDENKDEYLWDNEWRKTEKMVEVYKIKGAPDFIDTLVFTHHGPVVYESGKDIYKGDAPIGHAMRWAGNETGGSDLRTFYDLNRAKNYDEYREALKSYTGPPQNFVFASNENDIAITSNGKLPAKWMEQGRFLMDGTKSEYDWKGWIPFEQNPTIRNPERNFVSSANQFPANLTYPYYLDWSFAHPSRALRINQRLEEMHKINVDSFKNLLNDNYSIDAAKVLPTLLEFLKNTPHVSSTYFEELHNWNYMNDANSVGATLFNTWIDIIHRDIWEDEFSREKGFRTPTFEQTLHYIQEIEESVWYDDVETQDKIETKSDILLRSFDKTLKKLEDNYGVLDSENWNWARVKATRVSHLVPNFVSFSRLNIDMGGHGNSVNATSERHGPSWKMVVQLDREWPKAYGLYPGGQSGNPSSKWYDNMVDQWSKGELMPLFFMKDSQDTSQTVLSKIILAP